MVSDSEQNYATDLAGLFVERAIQAELIKHVNALKTEELLTQINQEMMVLFSDIVNILNDQTLDDPNCFHRVEALVRAFEKIHFPVQRHDW